MDEEKGKVPGVKLASDNGVGKSMSTPDEPRAQATCETAALGCGVGTCGLRSLKLTAARYLIRCFILKAYITVHAIPSIELQELKMPKYFIEIHSLHARHPSLWGPMTKLGILMEGQSLACTEGML